jgi:roadblock/LC7 domain-containing protein
MRRVKVSAVALLAALSAALAPALAQGTETWTPQIDINFLRDWLVTGLKYSTYIVVVLAIVVAAAKFGVSHILERLGMAHMARAVSERADAFLGLVWLALGLVMFPFVVYALARAGALPPWVANEMARILQEIWTWSPSK